MYSPRGEPERTDDILADVQEIVARVDSHLEEQKDETDDVGRHAEALIGEAARNLICGENVCVFPLRCDSFYDALDNLLSPPRFLKWLLQNLHSCM